MDQGLEDAVDAGFGDAGFLVDVFERYRGMVFFEKLDDVEGLGEDGDEVEPFDLGFGQSRLRREIQGVKVSIQNIRSTGIEDQGTGNREQWYEIRDHGMGSMETTRGGCYQGIEVEMEGSGGARCLTSKCGLKAYQVWAGI
jgi:hypothetical protein